MLLLRREVFLHSPSLLQDSSPICTLRHKQLCWLTWHSFSFHCKYLPCLLSRRGSGSPCLVSFSQRLHMPAALGLLPVCGQEGRRTSPHPCLHLSGTWVSLRYLHVCQRTKMGMHGRRARWCNRCPSAQKIFSLCYPSQGESQDLEQHPLELHTAEILLDLVLLLLTCLDLLTMVSLVKKIFKQVEARLLSHFC